MELGLSLGDPPKPFGFLEKHSRSGNDEKGSAFCMDLSIGPCRTREDGEELEELRREEQQGIRNDIVSIASVENIIGNDKKSVSSPVQLDLLPLSPVPRTTTATTTTTHGFPWSSPTDKECGGSGGLELNRIPKLTASVAVTEDVAEEGSSPNSNSGASSFQMEMCLYNVNYNNKGLDKNNNNNNNYKRDNYFSEGEGERNSNSRASDEDEPNGVNRKKLRLSKDQSAFLEESFKEHNTLNPKQKLALAKQLNLRPRQVEVWFQNRRARTKLKQTEVDCEYLKRCCETLTEENRRLHKELQELRALKTSNPFYMQLPATTLTMCPSCERVATTSTATATATAKTSTTTVAGTTNTSTGSNSNDSKGVAGFPLNRPKFYPFSHAQTT